MILFIATPSTAECEHIFVYINPSKSNQMLMMTFPNFVWNGASVTQLNRIAHIYEYVYQNISSSSSSHYKIFIPLFVYFYLCIWTNMFGYTRTHKHQFSIVAIYRTFTMGKKDDKLLLLLLKKMSFWTFFNADVYIHSRPLCPHLNWHMCPWKDIMYILVEIS